MVEAEPDLGAAADRLERALNALEQRIHALKAQSQASSQQLDEAGLFDQDRARLADELDQARERSRLLEAAAAEASLALGRAARDVRAVLSGEA